VCGSGGDAEQPGIFSGTRWQESFVSDLYLSFLFYPLCLTSSDTPPAEHARRELAQRPISFQAARLAGLLADMGGTTLATVSFDS
jgi:hypothetical protein